MALLCAAVGIYIIQKAKCTYFRPMFFCEVCQSFVPFDDVVFLKCMPSRRHLFIYYLPFSCTIRTHDLAINEHEAKNHNATDLVKSEAKYFVT